jgi:hypothetical protein
LECCVACFLNGYSWSEAAAHNRVSPHDWLAAWLQILRGSDNRFAQVCERRGLPDSESCIRLHGFAEAAAHDLNILEHLAVDDETLLSWIASCEAPPDVEYCAAWAQAGTGLQ